jgi:hypothetical protein
MSTAVEKKMQRIRRKTTVKAQKPQKDMVASLRSAMLLATKGTEECLNKNEIQNGNKNRKDLKR